MAPRRRARAAEPHPGAPLRPRRLRSVSAQPRPADGALTPLGLPRPIEVQPGPGGEPRELRRPRRAPLAVERIEEAWRIADEWWREPPLSRSYYRVVLEGGGTLTLFHDATQPLACGWYEQRY
ncbi:MAG: hypothetical protein F4X76_12385 [Chloroflexi bacterium]|nr:hypothetical protein [Chloroflexota bacterium]